MPIIDYQALCDVGIFREDVLSWFANTSIVKTACPEYINNLIIRELSTELSKHVCA